MICLFKVNQNNLVCLLIIRVVICCGPAMRTLIQYFYIAAAASLLEKYYLVTHYESPMLCGVFFGGFGGKKGLEVKNKVKRTFLW